MSARPAPSRPVAGILWMVLSGLCFVAVTGIVKHLGPALPASQTAFLRYAFGLVMTVPMLLQSRAAIPAPRALRLYGLRGAVHAVGVLCWFYAMTRISIAEVTALNYMSPVYVALGAALFLGETLALRRLVAIGLALLGGLVILRPGFRELSPGHLAMVATAILFAVSYLIAKRMSDTENPAMMVAMLSLTVTIGLAPFALAVWVTPSPVQLAWLVLLGAVATGGHYAMTYAFVAAPVTVTQPVTFLQLVWAVALGALVFSEPVDGWVLLGGATIMAAISFLTWREALARRRSAPAAVPVK